MKSTLSRRRLLGRAGAAIAAPYFLTSAALGDDKRPAASERIVMGTIGTGGQGTGHIPATMNFTSVSRHRNR